MADMKVWILFRGQYSQRDVFGVYTTAEAGMADVPAPEGEWELNEYGEWTDDGDAQLIEYHLDS